MLETKILVDSRQKLYQKGLGHKMAWGTFQDIFGFSIGKKLSETIFHELIFQDDQNGITRFFKKKNVSLPKLGFFSG